jgi:hypothetical protein
LGENISLALLEELSSASCAGGRLMTVFSAPDYPQFQVGDASQRFNNLGAALVLSGPDFATPEARQYGAAPRPQVRLSIWMHNVF